MFANVKLNSAIIIKVSVQNKSSVRDAQFRKDVKIIISALTGAAPGFRSLL